MWANRMSCMLPLEKLTEEAAAGFREHGVDPDSLDIVLELDLDNEGNFGESWLALNAKDKNALLNLYNLG